MKYTKLIFVCLASLSFSSIAMAINCEPIGTVCPPQEELLLVQWVKTGINGEFNLSLSPFSGTFYGVLGDPKEIPKEIVINTISGELKETATAYIFSCNYRGQNFSEGTLTMTLGKSDFKCNAKNTTSIECCPNVDECKDKCHF